MKLDRVDPSELIGQRVRVHVNLHRGTVSISRKGRVLADAWQVTLEDARAIVSDAGRERVLARGKRAVHAWWEGTLVAADAPSLVCGEHVTYNPHRDRSFVLYDDRSVAVTSARRIHFQDRYAFREA